MLRFDPAVSQRHVLRSCDIYRTSSTSKSRGSTNEKAHALQQNSEQQQRETENAAVKLPCAIAGRITNHEAVRRIACV